MHISRKLIRTQLRPELDQAIDQVLAKYGMTGSLAGISYQDEFFTGTIKVQVIGADTPEQKAYRNNQFRHGLPPLETTVMDRDGVIYSIQGYKSRSPKYPILLQDLYGKRTKCTVGYLLSCDWEGK